VGAVIQATNAKGELLAGMLQGTQQAVLAPLADLGAETVLDADFAFYDLAGRQAAYAISSVERCDDHFL
jgi:hypothetical protein